MPAGWLARIDRAAEAGGFGRAEWLRALVRRALESAERAERRRKAS